MSIPCWVLEAAEEPSLLLEGVGQGVDVAAVGGEGDDAEGGAAEHPQPGNLANAALQERKL